MSYVDGVVIPVPTGNKQAFIEQAREFDALLMQFGALRVMECWGDDVPAGKLTDFYRAVRTANGETVVFSWVEWPNKATRDTGFAQMEASMQTDLRFKDRPMAFDGKRLVFGGFSPVVEL